MDNGDLRVVVMMKYNDISLTVPVQGNSGNPLYAPREANKLAIEALETALNMLRAATGDIDARPSADPRAPGL